MQPARAAMTARERFHAAFDGKPVDRLPMVEWATWWDKTIDRWHGDGLPAELTNKTPCEISEYFGLDPWFQIWTMIQHWECPYKPDHHGAGILDAAGGDYEKIAPYVGRWPVIRSQWDEAFARQKTKGTTVFFTLPGFFWGPRNLFGIHRHLTAFYDEPEIMHRMNQANADWMLRYIDEVCALGQPDFMTFAEDLSYNNGPMLSKKCFDTFLLPYYQQVVPKLKERGIRVVVDSDGDVTKCMPWFLNAGIEAILPLERQAGCDINAMRRDFPEMRLIGGFNKLIMEDGEAAMRAEFERIMPAMRGGKVIPSVDHQTPPNVSLDNYRIYVRLLKEYCTAAVR